MPLQLKGGFEANDPRLGRVPEWDRRNRRYLAVERVPDAARPRSYTWRCDLYLNQLKTPRCVGYSTAHEIAARPVVCPASVRLADRIYARAQQLDDWPGEHYDGTSVLAGMKAATELGYFSEYRWALDLDDLIMAVGHLGPVVLGIEWWTGMFKPSWLGTVELTGQPEGGHAILCNGVSLRRKVFRLHNSWGQEWGLGGECFIGFEEMRHLLAAEGEAAIPTHRTRGAGDGA